MVQKKSTGIFHAPAPLPSRIRPIAAYLPAPKILELEPTTSAAIRPLTNIEADLLELLSKLSAPILKSTNLNSTLQEVKELLYNKEYMKAFGSKEIYREAYAARWVPSRVLIYRKVLRESSEIKEALLRSKEGDVRKVICLGGGAGSEVIAIGSLLSKVSEETWEGKGRVEVIAVDNCDWSVVLKKQEDAMLDGWSTLEGKFSVKFLQADILAFPVPSSEASTSIIPPPEPIIPYHEATLVTLLFTISELFLQSRLTTLKLLAHITSQSKRNTLLLVVESASLGQIPIGTSGRSHALSTLLDYTLSEDKGSGGGAAKWQKVREEESVWYRMPEGAASAYPLKLENSRVVIRLYRKL